MSDEVFLDFETFSHIDLIKRGISPYATDPSTDIVLIGYIVNDESYGVSYSPQELAARDPIAVAAHNRLCSLIENGCRVIAHNVGFELLLWKFVGIPRYQFPVILPNQWRCTQTVALKMGMPKALQFAAKALRLDHQKLATGKDLINVFSIPQPNGKRIHLHERPDDAAKFKEYNLVDCEVSRDIWRLLPPMKEPELRTWELDATIKGRGIKCNVQLAQKIYDNLEKVKETFGVRLVELSGGQISRPTQAARIKDFVNTRNSLVDMPDCTADTVEAMLEEGNKTLLDKESIEILEIRQHGGKSSTGKYIRYIENTSLDEEIYALIQHHGAHTGRGASYGLQLQNLPKPSIEYESMDVLINDLDNFSINQMIEKYNSYPKAASTAIRGIIEAHPGRILAVGDYNAIEARLVMWLANCRRGLEEFTSGLDIYKMMGGDVYGKNPAILEKDGIERWVGKQLILGAGFGLGGKGFINTCGRYGVKIGEDLANRAIYDGFRMRYSEVPDLWEDLDNAALRACQTGKIQYSANKRIAWKLWKTKTDIKYLLCKLPSGRLLFYPHVKLAKTEQPWGGTRVSVVYSRYHDRTPVRETMYGGKWLENIIQGIAADILHQGAWNVEHDAFDYLFAVHDEVVAEVDEGQADLEKFLELMCAPMDVSYATVPLKAEGKLTKTYQKI